MLKYLSIFFLLMFSLLTTLYGAKDNYYKTTDDSLVNSLINQMSLEEKIGQLVQYSDTLQPTGPTGEKLDVEDEIIKGRVGSLLNVIGVEETKRLQDVAIKQSRLGIPLIFGLDVIHGYKTIFPVPLAMSSTWNMKAIEEAAHIGAVEASASGINWTFAPMVDICRDPRWGRIVEGAGEDPYLGAEVAKAQVRGFQGKNLAATDTVLACAKHYLGYGEAIAGRDYNNTDISARTLWEIYLPPFQAAIDENVGSVMTAFNDVNGVPMTGNKELLTDVLKHKLGFKGFVVSDWNSVAEMIPHGFAKDTAQAAKLALEAGMDMDMVSGVYNLELLKLLADKQITMKQLDDAVKRVLRAKFMLGLFENPYKYCDYGREKHFILTQKHREAARRIAREAIILLKNKNNLLPLSKNIKTIALIGPLADNKRDMLGPWHAQGKPKDVVTLLQGIRNAVSKNTRVLYSKGCEIDRQIAKLLYPQKETKNTSGATTSATKEKTDAEMIKEAVAVAKKADVIIAAVGEYADMSGEAHSRANIDLPGKQRELLKALKKTGKPIVVVLINGRPLTINWTKKNIPAILETWFLGSEAGNAIADVLFGDYNPSGKLTVTFPYAVGQIPIFYNHRSIGRPQLDHKPDEHFVSRYLDIPNDPLYPFGYGLSYTKFKYSDIKLNKNVITTTTENGLIASVDVTNIGKVKGKETVQLYIQDLYASVTQPMKELVAFKQITLAPGETKKVSFHITQKDLTMYNIKMEKVVEPGEFKVYIGTNSQDLKEAEFKVTGNTFYY